MTHIPHLGYVSGIDDKYAKEKGMDVEPGWGRRPATIQMKRRRPLEEEYEYDGFDADDHSEFAEG